MTIAPEDEPPKTRHVPRISFCIPSAKVSSLLKKLLISGSSGSVDRLPSLNDWAETMSNLECKCPAVDGLPNHSGNSSDYVRPLSDTSVTPSSPVTKSTRTSCIIGVCATPANEKLTMERKIKIRATVLCRRIFAGCVTWKR